MKRTWTIFEGDKFWWDGSWEVEFGSDGGCSKSGTLSLHRTSPWLFHSLVYFCQPGYYNPSLEVCNNEWVMATETKPLRYPAATCPRQKQSFLCAQNAGYADKHKYRKSFFNCPVPWTDFISQTTSLILVPAEKIRDTGVYPKLGDSHTFLHGCQL